MPSKWEQEAALNQAQGIYGKDGFRKPVKAPRPKIRLAKVLPARRFRLR